MFSDKQLVTIAIIAGSYLVLSNMAARYGGYGTNPPVLAVLAHGTMIVSQRVASLSGRLSLAAEKIYYDTINQS